MRVGPTTGTHTVNYALAGVTATAGADFNAAGGTLTFGPGVASRTITVPVVTDTINETAETFTVTLSGPSAGAALGTPTVATVTITDDDSAGTVQFAASSFSVVEGSNVTLTVTRTGGTAGPVTVAYSATPGTASISDFMTSSGVLTFAAGESTRTFNIGVALGDAVVEGNEFFDVVLGVTTGGLALGTPSRARVWIVDEEQSLQFSASTYGVIEGGTATITVTRVGVPAGTASATVVLGGTAVAGTDYVTPPSLVLTFPPGVVTQTLTIQTLPDTLAEGVRTLTLGLTGLSGAVAGTPASALLGIADNERPDLTVTTVSGPDPGGHRAADDGDGDGAQPGRGPRAREQAGRVPLAVQQHARRGNSHRARRRPRGGGARLDGRDRVRDGPRQLLGGLLFPLGRGRCPRRHRRGERGQQRAHGGFTGPGDPPAARPDRDDGAAARQHPVRQARERAGAGP